MPRIRRPKDPFESGDDARPLSKSDAAYFKTVRKVLFRKVSLRVGGEITNDSRIAFYTDCIAQEAARKKPSSQSEVRKIRDIGRLAPRARRTSRRATPLASTFERQERQSQIAYKIFWPIMFGLLPGFEKEFSHVYGDLGNISKVLPEYMRCHPSFAEFWKNFRRARRKRVKGQPYDVGFGRTPEATRFRKGRSGNLQGRPKQKSLFDRLDQSLSRQVTMTKADGSTTKITQAEAAVIQIWDDAMRGIPRARAELRELIKALHLDDLLSPVPRPPRVRVPGNNDKIVVAGASTFLVGMIKRDLVRRFTERFGPVPPFTTDFERSFPALGEIEGLAALCQQRREAGDPIAALEGGATDQLATEDVCAEHFEANTSTIIDYEYEAQRHFVDEHKAEAVGGKYVSVPNDVGNSHRAKTASVPRIKVRKVTDNKDIVDANIASATKKIRNAKNKNASSPKSKSI